MFCIVRNIGEYITPVMCLYCHECKGVQEISDVLGIALNVGDHRDQCCDWYFHDCKRVHKACALLGIVGYYSRLVMGLVLS